MGYVRARDIEKIDPATVAALGRLVGLALPPERLDELALALASQLESTKSAEALDLAGLAPAVHMDARWPDAQ